VITPCLTAKKIPTMDDYKDAALLTKSTQYLISYYYEIFNEERDIQLIERIFSTHYDFERLMKNFKKVDLVISKESNFETTFDDIPEVKEEGEDCITPRIPKKEIHYVSTRNFDSPKDSDISKRSKSFETFQEDTRDFSLSSISQGDEKTTNRSNSEQQVSYENSAISKIKKSFMKSFLNVKK
jgi:hypothetical protein